MKRYLGIVFLVLLQKIHTKLSQVDQVLELLGWRHHHVAPQVIWQIDFTCNRYSPDLVSSPSDSLTLDFRLPRQAGVVYQGRRLQALLNHRTHLLRGHRCHDVLHEHPFQQ